MPASSIRCYQCGQYTDGVGSITPCINYTERLHLKECPHPTAQHCIVSTLLLPHYTRTFLAHSLYVILSCVQSKQMCVSRGLHKNFELICYSHATMCVHSQLHFFIDDSVHRVSTKEVLT